MDENGGFTATLAAAAPGPHALKFTPQNSMGTDGAVATVNVVFPSASNLQVTLIDGVDEGSA